MVDGRFLPRFRPPTTSVIYTPYDVVGTSRRASTTNCWIRLGTGQVRRWKIVTCLACWELLALPANMDIPRRMRTVSPRGPLKNSERRRPKPRKLQDSTTAGSARARDSPANNRADKLEAVKYVQGRGRLEKPRRPCHLHAEDLMSAS